MREIIVCVFWCFGITIAIHWFTWISAEFSWFDKGRNTLFVTSVGFALAASQRWWTYCRLHLQKPSETWHLLMAARSSRSDLLCSGLSQLRGQIRGWSTVLPLLISCQNDGQLIMAISPFFPKWEEQGLLQDILLCDSKALPGMPIISTISHCLMAPLRRAFSSIYTPVFS